MVCVGCVRKMISNGNNECPECREKLDINMIDKLIPVTIEQLFDSILEDNDVKNTVNKYIEQGGDLNVTNEHGFTLLVVACFKDNIEIAELLIKKGVNVDQYFSDGTALHEMTYDSNKKMVSFLIENGADVNSTDKNGRTPLHNATTCRTTTTQC